MPLSLLRKLAARRPTAPRTRLSLVALEERVVPSTLYVDDDRRQYPQARFTSIQAAVRQAKPGDTVQVYPGLYKEVVTVDKAGLKLIGDSVGASIRTGDTAKEVVVTAVKASPLGVVNLRANGAELRGFTVQGNTTGPGVFTDPEYSG